MTTRRSPHPSAGALALGLALLALGGRAAAAPPGPKEAQARATLKQALDEDFFETRFDDAEQKLRSAIVACGANECSARLRAELHTALGTVLASGKKQLDDARDEFVAALLLDPKIQPDAGMASTEVSFAYEAARKQLKLGADPKPEGPLKPEKPKAPEPVPDPPPAKRPLPRLDDDKPKEPEAPPPRTRKNWITLSFAPDISVVSGSNVCTRDVQKADNYVCLRTDKTRYVGTPERDNADNINPGMALSTLRLMLGYDRVLVENLTLGARVGFAFNSASEGGAQYLPVHVEGRIGYWPGKTPFATAGIRPYIMLSGGLAKVDTRVNVNLKEDDQACGPVDANKRCTLPSSDGVYEPQVQTVLAYRQAGLGFAALNFGVQFAPTSMLALYLAVRGSVTFPVVTGVLSPEGGLSVGF